MEEFELTEKHYAIAKKNGLSRKLVYNRFYYSNWSINDCITTPVLRGNRRAEHKHPRIDITDEQLEIAKMNNIPYRYLRERVERYGWSVERAVNTPIRKYGGDDMKLKDLRPKLRAERVNLYIATGKPIKYEMWGLDDETNSLAEYRLIDRIDGRKNDTMFRDYGDYIVDEISTDKDGAIAISISGRKSKLI